MKYKNLLLFLSGIIFYDGLNHLILAIKQSPYSVHGVDVGITGNWIIFAFDWTIVVAIIILLKIKSKKKL